MQKFSKGKGNHADSFALRRCKSKIRQKCFGLKVSPLGNGNKNQRKQRNFASPSFGGRNPLTAQTPPTPDANKPPAGGCLPRGILGLEERRDRMPGTVEGGRTGPVEVPLGLVITTLTEVPPHPMGLQCSLPMTVLIVGGGGEEHRVHWNM